MARQARTTLCFGLVLLISLVSKALAQGWPYRRYCPCICSELSSPELTYALGPGMFKQVDCQYRNLNDVPSSFPPDTQVLLLNNNNILNITDNIDYLYDLKYLDVSHNFLSAIYRDDIAANRRLQFINAGWNQISYISRLSFKTMSKLKHLLLSTNNLLYIPQAVYGLTTLAVLDLSKNKILGVFSDSLQGLDRLQFLLLENNNIGTVQLGAFFQTPQLVNLNLDGNRITYLPPQIFNGLTSLEVLKLNDNLLQGVTSGVFNILYNIQTLDLHGNRVTSLDRATFHGLSLLQNLDLKENEIRSLPMTLFQGLVSLQTLDISENPNIGTLPYGLFAGLYNLQTITLSHVTRVPQNLFTGLTKLQSIRMSDSRLPLITPSYFMDLSQLQVLELPNNCIEILQPSSFSRLRILATLDLSDNLIKSVDNTPFSGTRFPSLTRLHLQNNRIGEIQAGAFANLPSLQELRLDNNSIPLIPAGIFSHGTKLRSITLDNNQIHTIDGGFIPTITNVDRLTVVNNYLSCDCQLFEFAQWFQQHWQSVERANDVYCYAPEVYKNRRLIDLITTNKNPFICVHPRITTEPKIANVTKVMGENVYLHCHITPKAVATLTWTLPSLLEIDAPSFPPLMNHTTRALANHYGTLVLYDIQKNNSGIYKCTSSNTIGSDFIIYNVVVNDRPPPTLTPPTTKAPRPGTTHAGVPGTTHAGVPGGATTIRPGHNGTDSPCHPNPCMNDGVCSDILKEHSEENSSVLSQESTEFGQDPLMYVVRCTCHKNYGGSLCQYRKPETPREITVIRSTKNYITLTWKGAEMQHVQGYRVLYSIVGERTVIKSVPIHPTVQTYTMEELDMDVSYRICVVAFNEGGESLLGSSNCIWAETQKAAERKNSIFNMQLVAIGGGCLAVVIGLFLIGYVYQKLKERQQDKEEFGEPSSMQQAGRTGSVSEVLRRNVRRPMTSTSSFYSNSDDVMLIDIQGYPERQMYMNPMDSRQGMLRGDLDRTHGFREFIPGEPDLFPKAANKRKTLKIQDTSM
ncbi:uncharacterized protein [Asterias amurensis]|uniref:uncharacterized protein n=1 Tax=Asterias amurensis TaxID=7602 RepID=UPI003AB2B18F